MWELDVCLDGRTWTTVKKGPSCDSCKNEARKWYRDEFGNNKPLISFRIYALDGQQLHVVSSNNRSWRLKWSWGNLLSRQQQEEKDIL